VVPAGGLGTIRFYGTGLAPGVHCGKVTLTAPPGRAATWRVMRGGRRVGAGSLDPGNRREVSIPLPRLVERGFTDVGVGGDGAQVLAAGVADRC
jgi:hypothetical protein